MRLGALPAACAAAAVLAGGCAMLDRPHRPTAGTVEPSHRPDSPAGTLERPHRAGAPTAVTHDRPHRAVTLDRPAARGAAPASREGRIRVVSAPVIREVSAAGIPANAADRSRIPAAVSTAGCASADECVRQPSAVSADERAKLPAPHRETSPRPPEPRTPAELRALVGQRDRREPIAAAVAWARALGTPVDGDLLAWAERHQRLAGAIYPPAPGDLLVFDHATSDEPSDLVAVAIDRDARGVTELVYLGGGIVRRGFVDASHPAVHRDRRGAVVNTYLRHGKRWPPEGTHYLAGELLAHVIRVH